MLALGQQRLPVTEMRFRNFRAGLGAAEDEEHWAEETACKRQRIEISLVFVTIMLHVLAYVVSNNLKLF